MMHNYLTNWPSWYEDCEDEPEQAWQRLLEIIGQPLSDEDASELAAGPLEMLLSRHGSLLIDRVELHAAHHIKFNHLLGGVWRNTIPADIWERVCRSRKAIW